MDRQRLDASGQRWCRLDLRNRIRVKNGEPLERLQKNIRGMNTLRFIRPMRSGKELRFGTAGDVLLKNFVRIIKVRHDDVKCAEVFAQGGIQCATSGEKPGQ